MIKNTTKEGKKTRSHRSRFVNMQSVRAKLICFPRDEIKKYDKRYKLLRPQFARVPTSAFCWFFFYKSSFISETAVLCFMNFSFVISGEGTSNKHNSCI